MTSATDVLIHGAGDSGCAGGSALMLVTRVRYLTDFVRGEGVDPEGEAVLADSIGVALLVVLDMLTPAERLAFVLHDHTSPGTGGEAIAFPGSRLSDG
jgi:hypothetical protein